MRTLVVLACFCAVAYGGVQTEDLYSLSQTSSLNDNSEISDASQFNYGSGSTIDYEQYYSTPSPYNYEAKYTTVAVEDGTKADEANSGRITSERKGRYRALDQDNVESAPIGISSSTCKEKNERYSIPSSCDKYIECLNGTAEEKQCPDGLRYNPNVKFNVYPCQYPIDVPCLGRAALQPANPTADCPHQFGYFKTGDSRNCSGFRNCVNGVGYDFSCPEGLAFSSDTYRCEWPDEVTDCDAEAFLGFRCPEVPISKELGPPAGFRTYRSSTDCQIYFICINNKPRRLTCGGYSAFDEETGSCVAADEISACPVELRNAATRSRDAEEKRKSAQTAFEKLRYAPKEYTDSSTTAEPIYVPDYDDNQTQRPFDG